MKRSIASIALAAFIFCYLVPVSQANVCVFPKIKLAQACGYVVDKFGEPVPNADIKFYFDIDTIPAKTDARGFFERKDLPEGKISIKVNAAGFANASTTIETLTKPTKNCDRPLWIMLDLGMDACSAIATRHKDLPLRKRER